MQVMACENAINATDLLRDEVAAAAGESWTDLQSRAVFANTAVVRIVPAQPDGSGVDVTVEPFFEWAIERPPFGDNPPQIPPPPDLTPPQPQPQPAPPPTVKARKKRG